MLRHIIYKYWKIVMSDDPSDKIRTKSNNLVRNQYVREEEIEIKEVLNAILSG